jgi:hypothetical protein
MCFQAHIMLSHRLKGKWSPRRRQGFHSTPSNYSSFAVALQCSSIWYNLHSYFIYQRGRKFEKKAYISLISIRFWRFMPNGEKSISPKQKVFQKHIVFQICVKKRFFNWYLIFDIISNLYTLFKITI